MHHTQVNACLDACAGFVIAALHMDSMYGCVPAVLPTLSKEGKETQAKTNPDLAHGSQPCVYADIAYCPPFDSTMDMTFEGIRQYITKCVLLTGYIKSLKNVTNICCACTLCPCRQLNTENIKLIKKSNRRHHSQRLDECKAQAMAMVKAHKDSFGDFLSKDATDFANEVSCSTLNATHTLFFELALHVITLACA